MTPSGHKQHVFACRVLLAAAMAYGFALPAGAQMYPGADVQVNQSAAGGTRVLRYPGGKYMRVLPRLLQPGEAYPGSPQAAIHLHMPGHHAARYKARPVAETGPPEETASETGIAPPAAPLHKSQPVQQEAVAGPASAPDGGAAIPFSFGGNGSAASPPAKTPPEQRQAERQPQAPAKPAAGQPRQAVPKPEKTASAAPAPAVSSTRGLVKQMAILFDQNSSELSSNSGAQLKDLTFSLNTALASGADRVELIGYGGAPGDKSSDARRLSLKRALAIRETLIADGLPANRIDVRALGGADDDGPANRVDIFIKG